MALRSALYSLILGTVVLLLKGGAYRLTGSVALFSDALESVINVVGAGAALVALWYARKPADEGHPYGHEKAQYFSAVLEGVLIVIASAAIIIRVIQDRRSPMPLESLGIGLVVSGAATVMNLLYGMYMLRVGRRLHSPALVADGKHLMSDVVTSVGVLTGLGLVALTGWRLFDPILALGVACYILFVGWRLVHSSLSSLLDEAAPAEVQNRIRALVKAHAEGAIEAHDFRTRNSGRRVALILSHRLWTRQFGADPHILGRVLHLDESHLTVVGVLPPDFKPLIKATSEFDPEMYYPLTLDPFTPCRTCDTVHVIGRLGRGVSPAAARAELDSLLQPIVRQAPDAHLRGARVALSLLPDRILGRARVALWAVSGAVAFVLLIACANVANLPLHRATGCAREIAVR